MPSPEKQETDLLAAAQNALEVMEYEGLCQDRDCYEPNCANAIGLLRVGIASERQRCEKDKEKWAAVKELVDSASDYQKRLMPSEYKESEIAARFRRAIRRLDELGIKGA